MDSLLKRILASPFRRRSRIERDERGRMSRVSATLGPAVGRAEADRTDDDALPEVAEPDERERASRVDAARWLDAAALRDARAFALGEERSHKFDQTTGTLSLRHADGVTLALSGEIIGSFRPQDRSFRWAWANPNVAPEMVQAALSAREQLATDAARTPTFRASYADSKALAALAARAGGLDGVYRAVTDGHLSIFLGYRAPEGTLSAVKPRPEEVEPEANLAEAVALVDRYDAAMLPIDVDAHEREAAEPPPEDDECVRILTEAVEAKRKVHERFWYRPDGYWDPVSVDWPSPHDGSRQHRRIALPRRAGGAYVITQGGHETDALVVQWVEGEWRIADRDLEWGNGLPLLGPNELTGANEQRDASSATGAA